MRDVVAMGCVLVMMSACTNEVSLGLQTSVADATEEVSEPSLKNCLAATPFRVEFGVVRRGELAERELRITNGCDEPVGLSGFTLSGDADFGVQVGGTRWKVSPETATQGISLTADWMVPARGEVSATVSYEPSQPDSANGVLVWLGESGEEALSLVVKLQANDKTPCIATQPKTLDYGGKVVGEEVVREVAITSCGDGALHINGVDLTAVEVEGLMESPFALAGLTDPLPWIIEPGETRSLAVSYQPMEVAGLDDDGERLRDRANLVLMTNAFDGDHEVGVRGFGVLEACPEAVIHFEGDGALEASASLLLQGLDSWSTDGAITSYHWTRELPNGGLEHLAEGAEATSISVEFSMVGEHVVRLSVEDSTGLVSCAPAEVIVTVEASAGLHVELVWTTTGDPDPMDEGFEKGTDLDLHVLHPLAVGEDIDGDGSGDGWFDHPLDVFWGNLHPNWGQVGDPKITDDPRLLRDDIDSLGPEVIVLGEPQEGAAYRIGVHSWSEHGFGPSEARVRVWLDGALHYTSDSTLLLEGDLWEVGSVSPSTSQFTPLVDESGEPMTWKVSPGVLSKK